MAPRVETMALFGVFTGTPDSDQLQRLLFELLRLRFGRHILRKRLFRNFSSF